MKKHVTLRHLAVVAVRHVRESSLAKVSLGTLPQVEVAAVNSKRGVVARFKTKLMQSCHASIYDCYVRFNATGQ